MTIFLRRALLAVSLAGAAGGAHAQCVNINAVDVAVAEDFDGLATSGTTNALDLPGWAMVESGGGGRDNDLYGADNGASNSGDTYSYGAPGASDRALGGLRSGSLDPVFGACYTNNTGGVIEALDIAYTGEQWRLGTAGRADQLLFEYSLDATGHGDGAWSGVAALDFSSPSTTTTGALDGNDAANRSLRSGSIGSLSVAPGASVWIRWNDFNASGADDGLAVDDLAVTARGTGGGGDPVLSIGDTGTAEGDSGTTPFFFVVSLSAPAGAGGVSFDYATADGTAVAGEDYVAKASSATIAEGASSVTVHVDVIGDTTPEAAETFVVQVDGITGAIGGDVSATGTIHNDDVSLVPIHDIQGPGATSPLAGAIVTTRGIVTGRKNNGFFVQEPDATVDADPDTSEGLFVFTGAVPPAAAAIGNRVQATGTVLEYIPAADPGQLPMTELGGTVEVVLLDTGHALPAPVQLSTSLPAPGGALDQLERHEGMRVTAPSFTVVAPTGGTTHEPSATGTTNGIFHVVVTGTPRPFREPGIQRPDPPPAGSIPPIPQWDFNPELITVVSRAIGGDAIDVAAGTVLTGLVGPLDYGFRRYTIAPDPATPPVVSAAPVPTPARVPTPDEFTIAAYNIERFFDTDNDPGTDDPVLTPDALAARLQKASLAIRGYLHLPDVLGLVEVENLAVLQAIADRVNADVAGLGQPGPGYVALLQEGNDVGGIDVGYLVRTGEVAPGEARVVVDAVQQLGADTTWTEPGGGSSLLNDRPPLRLDATVNFADGRSTPVTAILVHQRSLSGAEGADANGERVRAKRQRQAAFLAGEIQALQVAEPGRSIITLGDFNAFGFNDGLVDAVNVVAGTPSPDEETAVAGDGVDLVDPDLLNLATQEPADQRYSFVFDGNAQSLDHVLVNQVLAAAASLDLDHARINADFPEVARNDADSPSRLSDHDPLLAYVALPAVTSADLSVEVEPQDASVPVGGTFVFDAVVANVGPDAAAFPGVGFAVDAPLEDFAVSAPTGWSCDTPEVEPGSTTIACTAATLAAGADAPFTATATAPAAAAGEVLTLAVAATSQTVDPDPANDAGIATVAVAAVADLSTTVSGPATFDRGTQPAWTVEVHNAGPSAAADAMVQLAADVPSAAASATAAAGWTCEREATRLFRATCVSDGGALAEGASASFTVTVGTGGKLFPPRFTVRGAAASASDDPQPADNADAMEARLSSMR